MRKRTRWLCAALIAVVAGALAGPAGGATPELFAGCATSLGGAKAEGSSASEGVTLDVNARVCRVTVGGFPASTHYARLRWLNGVSMGLGDDAWLYGTFSLPSDFYARQTSYMRLLWLDNYNLDPAHPRRLALLLYGGDHLPRLVRQRQGMEETILWKGTQLLPVGRAIRLAVHVRLSQQSTVNEIYLDGAKIGSVSAANVTAGATSTARFTRVGFGVDGAADLDSARVMFPMWRLGVTANGSKALAG